MRDLLTSAQGQAPPGELQPSCPAHAEFVICDCTIEDYHQGLKTGCHLEQRQLQRYEGLRRLLGRLAPAAVRLLQLRAEARQSPEQLACQVLPTDLVQVTAALAQVPAAELTTQQCCYTIARSGGYLGRKGDGPPGWKTLWKGWFSIQALLEGVHLAARLSFDWDASPNL